MAFRNTLPLSATCALVLLAGGAASQQTQPDLIFRVAGWNMESGESDSAFLRDQLADNVGVDVWGFSEVQNAAALSDFETGAEGGENSDFEAVLGTGGGGDRLAIVFDTSRLELTGFEELEAGDLFARHRPPLVAQFRGLTTGIAFKFMVNHLARGNAGARRDQAEFLNEWVRSQDLPVMAVGDYNFDYHIDFGDAGERDPAFDAMTEGNAWIWLRPDPLVKTQASGSFMTVLDFVFVANPPIDWTAESTILARHGDEPAMSIDFDDSEAASDHRPVDAVFRTHSSRRIIDDINEDNEDSRRLLPPDAVAAIEARLGALESEMKSLRALLEAQ